MKTLQGIQVTKIAVNLNYHQRTTFTANITDARFNPAHNSPIYNERQTQSA